MARDDRLHSPAAERNRGPILAQLQRVLPPRGLMLEIAAGSGQHAAHFAAGLPEWRWLPTDGDPRSLASMTAWCGSLANVLAPVTVDVMASTWPGVPAQVDAIYCANLLHIAPWATCPALFAGARRHLARGGLMLLYGPYIVDDEPTAPSNLAFNADLRARDTRWGLRRLADVLAEAAGVGLQLQERVNMPANNLLLVLGRAADGRE
ncbi:MAG TPA: DUF938 domain-containing protein [Rubrivivax sp.]|nr:DUF938 domain-containing protein [Rubrivivax sp.]